MTIENILSQVTELSLTNDYWFVRTDSGQYYDTFYKNNFIGIGWNTITIEDLRSSDRDQSIRQKIQEYENRLRSERGQTSLDGTSQIKKGDITNIHNKLKNFINLKSGDIVVMPSASSSRLAFGKITNSQTKSDIDESYGCPFQKRRDVLWLSEKGINELDASFYKIKVSRHTISKIDPQYYRFIDNVINTIYRRNDNTHFVLEIQKTGDINLNSLVSLIENLQTLTKAINENYSFGEEIDNSSICLNLQSPGLIEFKLAVGKSLVALATLLSLTCCNINPNADGNNLINNGQQQNPELMQFIETNNDTIGKIRLAMDTLDVNKDKINSFVWK